MKTLKKRLKETQLCIISARFCFRFGRFNPKVYGIYFSGLSQKSVEDSKNRGRLSEVVTGEELGWFISGACVAPV